MAKNNGVFAVIGGAVVGFVSAMCAFNAVTKKEVKGEEVAPVVNRRAEPVVSVKKPVMDEVKEPTPATESPKPATDTTVRKVKADDLMGEPTSVRFEGETQIDEFLFFDDEDEAIENRYDEAWEDASDAERDVYVMRKEAGRTTKDVFETPITADEVSESMTILKDREQENEKETFSTLDRLKETYGK